jgi:uncharacterized protein (TIGR00252 family)
MSTETGQLAEQAAAKYLKKQGYQILEKNWRTRWCEIDIIAQKNHVVYFVEVKYRANERHGSGMDYITPQKLQQMQFAAELWLSHNQQADIDYRLAVLEVSGEAFQVTAWIDEL